MVEILKGGGRFWAFLLAGAMWLTRVYVLWLHGCGKVKLGMTMWRRGDGKVVRRGKREGLGG